MPWSYCYGDAAEVDVLLALDEPLICIDPEQEFEAAPLARRQAFVERLRTAHAAGTRIWSCVEARTSYHTGIPYADFAAISDAMIPMQAWQVWEPRAWEPWFDDWDLQHYNGFPWLPADVTPTELQGSIDSAMRRYGGAAIWAAHLLDEPNT